MGDHPFDAVVFDLDGVVTKTALVHSKAWKRAFDEYLKRRSGREGEPFAEFTHKGDYLPYVDGKPRYDGVDSFLRSRGIVLPFGKPGDWPDAETVCGIGNRKNELVNELFAEGVEVFPSTVKLIEELRREGIRIGVASSSENCRAILVAAGLEELFETRVDGVVSAELGLAGKPAPDIFLRAARDLDAAPERSVVVEDAVSGVRAGARGGFGLVLGVAREGNYGELRKHGADLVVSDLEEIGVDTLDEWFDGGIESSVWTLHYDDLALEEEATREALCAVGNGVFGTRGALEECDTDGTSYPGTYLAGVYDRLPSEVAGRTVENEDLVNCPSWLPLTFRIDDGEWIDPKKVEVLSFRRSLDLRTGILKRETLLRDEEGRETRIVAERLASMANGRLAALRYEVMPLSYSATIQFRSRLDGEVENLGVKRYRDLETRHLEAVGAEGEGSLSALVVATRSSGIEIGLAARLAIAVDGEPCSPETVVSAEERQVSTEVEVEAKQGEKIVVEKVVAITASIHGVESPLESCRDLARSAPPFDEIAAESAARWAELWRRFDVQLTGDRRSQLLLRLHLYHLLCTASPLSAGIDASIPARGLSGEAYRGHVFWDVSFILPLFSMHLPETARAALLYRYRRLDEARRAAADEGSSSRGAMFPWQSGGDGREETQLLHLNPLSGEWGEDHSRRQRHVSLAIAWDVWTHFSLSGDTPFLESHGAELFLEICRFWAGKAKRDEATGRYHIDGVMGPDEYHEKLPGSAEGGLRDNAYTNLMVAWALGRAFDVLRALSDSARCRVVETIGLDEEDLARFREVGEGLRLVVDEGMLAQFDGYLSLDELDWEGYGKRYGDKAHRMDRVLKSEGKSPDAYKVAKQADTLMAWYLLSPKEVAHLVASLGYAEAIGDGMLERCYDYYVARTSHGSTLSKVVHAHVAALLGRTDEAFRAYEEALESDFVDVQGGTTGEGIHTGVMGGTVWTAIRAFAGVDLSQERLSVDPRLPARWKGLRFRLGHGGARYELEVCSDSVEIALDAESEPSVVLVQGEDVSLQPGEKKRISLATTA